MTDGSDKLLPEWPDNVGLNLLTGEFMLMTPEQQEVVKNQVYMAYINRLVNMALSPRKHTWIRNVGKSI